MKKQQEPKCDPCEKMFEENIHKIVQEGKGETRMNYDKKEKEVKQAFDTHAPHSEHKGPKR